MKITKAIKCFVFNKISEEKKRFGENSNSLCFVVIKIKQVFNQKAKLGFKEGHAHPFRNSFCFPNEALPLISSVKRQSTSVIPESTQR